MSELYKANDYINTLIDVMNPKKESKIRNVKGAGEEHSFGMVLNSHYYDSVSTMADNPHRFFTLYGPLYDPAGYATFRPAGREAQKIYQYESFVRSFSKPKFL